MRYTPPMQDATRDHGAQPLDGLMNRWGITNHQLVETSVETFTPSSAFFCELEIISEVVLAASALRCAI